MDLNVQVIAVNSTPALIFSGRGRLLLAGNGKISGASGTPAWTLTATPIELTLNEATDIYGSHASSGSISMIVAPF